MSISTHILDLSTGRPAAKVPVKLWRLGTERILLKTDHTDEDGRLKRLLPEDESMIPGIYVVRFETGAYFEARGVAGLYPFVEIAFSVEPGETHYHIPLLLSGNGYTTYRGS